MQGDEDKLGRFEWSIERQSSGIYMVREDAVKKWNEWESLKNAGYAMKVNVLGSTYLLHISKRDL